MLLSVKCEDYQPVHSVQGGAWLLTPLSCEPTLARVTSPVSSVHTAPVHSPGTQVPAYSAFTLPCMVNRYKHCRFWLFPVQSLDCSSKIYKITQSWQSENCTANNCISLSVHLFCCYLWRPAKIKDADCCCWQQSLTSVDFSPQKNRHKSYEWMSQLVHRSQQLSVNQLHLASCW